MFSLLYTILENRQTGPPIQQSHFWKRVRNEEVVASLGNLAKVQAFHVCRLQDVFFFFMLLSRLKLQQKENQNVQACKENQ